LTIASQQQHFITVPTVIAAATAVASINMEHAGKKQKVKAVHHHAGGSEALRLAAGEHGKVYDGDIVRRRTVIEEQVLAQEEKAEHIVGALPEEASQQSQSSLMQSVNLFLPEMLHGSLFVGHLVTDLDSVAGAIGAAALYGGTPAIASKVNSETQFALDYWKIDTPRTIEELLLEAPNADVCLVDHQQTSQMNPAINTDQIVGVIDHHALQSKTIVTDKPIYIDIRPWGSMSTIIAHTFITHSRRPPVPIAGMLLCAILSDTLNLQGPTTTDWDRLMVAVLAEIAHVNDIQLLASQQFKAKSQELANLSAVALVQGDQKSFSFAASGFTGDIGFAVVETTDDDAILTRVHELLPELVACKKEKHLQSLFLAVVNIVDLKSKLLLCGPTELSLAAAAFGGPVTDHVMDLGGLVSRKKDFIPAITKTIKNGWTSAGVVRGMSQVAISDLGKLEVDPEDPYGNVKRVGSVLDSPLPMRKDVSSAFDDDCMDEKKEDGPIMPID
jgi:inorganic pyrophosphatase/exopolyphosphatase